jgi:hypothetical protein
MDGHSKTTQANNTTTIEQGKRAFNAIHHSQRIASFISEARAISYAKAVAL